jgi:hypothetical protein
MPNLREWIVVMSSDLDGVAAHGATERRAASPGADHTKSDRQTRESGTDVCAKAGVERPRKRYRASMPALDYIPRLADKRLEELFAELPALMMVGPAPPAARRKSRRLHLAGCSAGVENAARDGVQGPPLMLD